MLFFVLYKQIVQNWRCIVFISRERQAKNYNKARACPEGWQNRLVANQKLFALLSLVERKGQKVYFTKQGLTMNVFL